MASQHRALAAWLSALSHCHSPGAARLGARGPFLSWTHEQHLAGPAGSEHPSGWLHHTTAFLFAAKSSLSFPVPQHARAADDEASWSLARYTAPSPCQGEPGRWHQRRAAGWELGVVTQRRF